MSSDPAAVRAALATLFSSLVLRALPDEPRGTAELVLAEVLNNICEHGYGHQHGQIDLTLRMVGKNLYCIVTDTGRPMPGGNLPAGRPVTLNTDPDATDDLPEGGFGWHLIRSLSQDLSYRRIGDTNHLSFRLEAP